MRSALQSAADIVNQVSRTHVALHLRPAFAGNVSAMRKLCDPDWGGAVLEGEHFSKLVPIAFAARVPPPAFRVLLAKALVKDRSPTVAISSAQTPAEFAAWCDYAAFEVPDEVPELVTIYRGTFGITSAEAAAGRHWSLEFDCSAWHATRQPGLNLIITAQVPRSSLVFIPNKRVELEVTPKTQPAVLDTCYDRRALEEAANRWLEFLVYLEATKLPREEVRRLQASEAGRRYLLASRAALLSSIG